MALHGRVVVNTHSIIVWSAWRLEEVAGEVNTYECMVTFYSEIGRRQLGRSEVFQIQHTYTDGAALLAAAVLTEAHRRRNPTKKES